MTPLYLRMLRFSLGDIQKPKEVDNGLRGKEKAMEQHRIRTILCNTCNTFALQNPILIFAEKYYYLFLKL